MHPLIAIPAITALVTRAYTRNSLTVPACAVAALSATAHALHPSSLPFTLLGVFFLLGTAATKVKHDVKATLTLAASGAAGGEGPRGVVQVLANSGVASLLCLVRAFGWVGTNGDGGGGAAVGGKECFGAGTGADLVLLGVVANYAAVTADTLSSELGILSRGLPRLITSLRTVPKGTNGGVTLAGVLAGMGGAAVIGVVSVLMLGFCDTTAGGVGKVWGKLGLGTRSGIDWDLGEKLGLWAAITVWGTLGSLLDSLLGAVLQASVVDRRTGKIVEGAGGKKVLVMGKSASTGMGGEGTKKELSRTIYSGRDILSNNQINLLMALIMSVGGMVVGGRIMGVDFKAVFS